MNITSPKLKIIEEDCYSLYVQSEGRLFREKEVIQVNIIGKEHNFGERPFSDKEDIEEHSVYNTTEKKLFDDAIIDESWSLGLEKEKTENFLKTTKSLIKLETIKERLLTILFKILFL